MSEYVAAVHGTSRRALVTGAAWSLPVVAVSAVAVPSSASSISGLLLSGTCSYALSSGLSSSTFTVEADAGGVSLPAGTTFTLTLTGGTPTDDLSDVSLGSFGGAPEPTEVAGGSATTRSWEFASAVVLPEYSAFAFIVAGISYSGTTPWQIVLTTSIGAPIVSTSYGTCSTTA